MSNSILTFTAIVASGALLWIAISLHILTVHAFEIVCILTDRPGSRPFHSRTGG
ncbi:hypothetical protein MKK88_22055 [Methylobacterium sp. E-005]|uniref:hypothetical protein n=1 Tax=Methylobacterium sp. E-005 TaxID=2836549 RepID=UPI001FBBD3CF|nr:hypothetical protein [Methylobacterium sp. E-005]MCJ2088641.1 hypothetical protein [Methylobacterium sp. E-005]